MTSRHTFEETYPAKDNYKRFDQRDSAFGRRLKETGRIVGFGTEEDRARRIKMNLPGFSLVDYVFNSAAGMYETLPGEHDSQGTSFYSWDSLGVAKKPGGIPQWGAPGESRRAHENTIYIAYDRHYIVWELIIYR